MSDALATTAAQAVIAAFDEGVLSLYEADDVARGHIEVVRRSGDIEPMPIMSMSIGIATSGERPNNFAARVRCCSHRRQGARKADAWVGVANRSAIGPP